MKKKDRNEEPEDVGKVPGQKEPHFQQIANASPDAIININSSGTIIFWSKAAERIFRYSEKTILGRDVTTLIPERYKLAHQRGMTRFFKTGKGRFINETVELEARRQDGSEFPIELSLSAWRTDNEAFATGIIRDITERKQNEEDLEKSYRTQKVLNSLLHLSITDIPLDEQLENALDIILSVPFMQLTPKGGIFIAEEDSPELLLSASRNLPKTLLVMCKKVPFGECLCGRAAASGEIIFTNSVDRRHEHRYEGIVPHGHYVVPIVSQYNVGKVLGVLVLYVPAGHVRNIHEEDFLSAVANTLAGVVERKQAQNELEQSEKLNRILIEIDMTINSTLDFDQIVQRVSYESMKAMDCQSSAIIMRENHEWVAKFVSGEIPHDFVGKEVSKVEKEFITPIENSKNLFISNDTHKDKRFDPKRRKKYKVRSFIGIPLIVRGNTIGILYLLRHLSPRTLSGVEIDFVRKLGFSVSIAIQNAQLYADERSISATLQEALLAVPERIDGIDFGYLYRSAKAETAEAGGDFYDFFELGDGKVGVVIGDVSGKGVEAATQTSLVKNTIRAYAYQYSSSPAKIMALTNSVVGKTLPSQIFVTVFLCVLDTRSGILTYTNAGHPPPIIRSRTQEVRHLAIGTPFIGMFSGIEFHNSKEALASDDILVLYTDGVTEARCDGKLFGEERLTRFIKELATPKPDEIPQLIIDELSGYSSCILVDDIALVAFSLKNHVSSRSHEVAS